MDREEALVRSQSGENPGGGYYTSSQRIQLRNFGLGRITRLSREVITGKPSSSGGLGRGGAIVPMSRLVDPGALAPPPSPPPVDPQSIFSLQKQISDLVKKNEEQDLVKRNLLETLSKEFDFIKVSVTDLGNNLKLIRNNFLSDERLESLNAQKEETERKQSAQEDYRIGKESLVEKKIMSALMAPINAIGEKLQFTLANVLRFFSILFTGWLVDKLINAFKASAEGNTKKLNDIKNAILKNLAIAGTVLIGLNLGFFRIAGTIARLAFTVGRFLLSNTLGRLFGGIAALAKKLVSGAARMLGFGGKAAASSSGAPVVSGASKVTMGAGTADEIAKAGGKVTAKPAGRAATAVAGLSDDAAKAAAKTAAAKTAGRFVPGLGTVISGAAATYDFSKGDVAGGVLNTLGMVPGPFGWVGTAGRLALEGVRMLGSENKEQPKTTATTSPATSSPKSTSPTPVSSPQTSSTPAASSIQPTITSPSTPQSSLLQSSITPTSSPNVPQSPISISDQPGVENNYLQLNTTSGNVSVTNNVTPLETYRKSFDQTLTGIAPTQSPKVSPSVQPIQNAIPHPGAQLVESESKPVNMASVLQETNNISNISQSTNKETNIQNTKINPQTSIMPMAVDYTMNMKNIPAEKEKTTSNYSLDETGEKDLSKIYSSEFIFAGQFDGVDGSSNESIFPITSAKTNRDPSKRIVVGPAPKSKPNIIYASSRNQQSSQSVPLKTGNASDVPNIPSSNPDNFYLLYSQVNYNVVI
jgi:hypothetical protein